MDTTTVLEIIAEIDTRIRQLTVNDEDPLYYGANDTEKAFIAYGVEEGLRELRDHLQSYIEEELNIAENSTGE